MGYGKNADVKIENVAITPQNAKMGSIVQVNFELLNQASETVALMVDFSIHFIKANGNANPKVFKLKAFELGPNQSQMCSKKVSLKAMTTRVLYPGSHQVEVIINGRSVLLGDFELIH
jgi:hypothetical protein